MTAIGAAWPQSQGLFLRSVVMAREECILAIETVNFSRSSISTRRTNTAGVEVAGHHERAFAFKQPADRARLPR